MPDTKIVSINYAFSDRKNGWYAQAVNAAGDQIGDAEYRYSKAEVLKIARQLATRFGNVPVKRW